MKNLHVHTWKKPIDIPIDIPIAQEVPGKCIREKPCQSVLPSLQKNKFFHYRFFQYVWPNPQEIFYLHGQFVDFFFLISLELRTKFDILDPKFDKLSIPRYKDLTLGIAKLESSLKL